MIFNGNNENKSKSDDEQEETADAIIPCLVYLGGLVGWLECQNDSQLDDKIIPQSQRQISHTDY